MPLVHDHESTRHLEFKRRVVFSNRFYPQAWPEAMREPTEAVIHDVGPVHPAEPVVTRGRSELIGTDAPPGSFVDVAIDLAAEWASEGMTFPLRLPPPDSSRVRTPLEFAIEHSNGEFWVTNAALQVCGTGATVREAIRAAWEDLEVSFEHFVDCDPDMLSPSGLEYRRELQRLTRERG